MLEQISDIVIAAEAMREIEAFRPWADSFTRNEARNPELYKRVRAELDKTLEPLQGILFYFPKPSTCLVGAELFRMKYPVEKSRSKANVEAMQVAERQLDLFWAEVVEQLRRGGHLKGLVGKLLTREQPERTADWVELPPKKKATKAGAASTAVPPVFDGPQPSTKVEPHQPKIKPKTRGAAEPSTASDAPASAAPAEAERLSFTVDNRSHKVFTTLFHQPSVSSTPGDIQWADFRRAMTQVGFGAFKLGGSAWQFSPGPTLVDADPASYARGIQFHEPHPVAKIPFYMARQFGRRLARTYGWGRESFQLAE